MIDGQPAARARLALMVLAVSVVFALVARGIAESLTVFLLPLEDEFQASRAAVTAIFSASIIASGLGGPWTGLMSDRLGPRTIYVGGLGLLAAACFLASEASAVWQLVAVLGLGFGLSSASLGMAGQTPMIRRWFPERTGTAIGVIGSATGLGILVFAPLAESLIQLYGWRGTYQVFAVLVGVLAVIAFALPWRRLEAGRSGEEHIRLGSDPASLAEVIGDPILWGIFAAYLLTAAGSLMVQPQLAAYFVDVGYTPLAAATWIGVGGIAGCAGMIVFGWLGDRLGVPTAVALSYVLTVSGILALAAMTWTSAAWLMPVYALTFAASFGSRGPLVMSMASRRWRGGVLGRVTGILLAAIGVGGGVGASLGGLLQDIAGYDAVFAAAAVALALGALAWWIVLRGLLPSRPAFGTRSADPADAE